MEDNNKPEQPTPSGEVSVSVSKRAAQAVAFVLLLTLAVFTGVAFRFVQKGASLSARAEQLMLQENLLQRMLQEADTRAAQVLKDRESLAQLQEQLRAQQLEAAKSLSKAFATAQEYAHAQKTWAAEAEQSAKVLKAMASVPIATTTVVSGNVGVTLQQAAEERSWWERTKDWWGGTKK